MEMNEIIELCNKRLMYLKEINNLYKNKTKLSIENIKLKYKQIWSMNQKDDEISFFCLQHSFSQHKNYEHIYYKYECQLFSLRFKIWIFNNNNKIDNLLINENIKLKKENDAWLMKDVELIFICYTKNGISYIKENDFKSFPCEISYILFEKRIYNLRKDFIKYSSIFKENLISYEIFENEIFKEMNYYSKIYNKNEYKIELKDIEECHLPPKQFPLCMQLSFLFLMDQNFELGYEGRNVKKCHLKNYELLQYIRVLKDIGLNSETLKKHLRKGFVENGNLNEEIFNKKQAKQANVYPNEIEKRRKFLKPLELNCIYLLNNNKIHSNNFVGCPWKLLNKEQLEKLNFISKKSIDLSNNRNYLEACKTSFEERNNNRKLSSLIYPLDFIFESFKI